MSSNPISSALSGAGKKAETWMAKPFKWIDASKSESQRRKRLAVVCTTMVLAGVAILAVSMATMGVFGPQGVNPAKFKLDLSTTPLFLIGCGLIGYGIGFAVDQSMRKWNPKQRKMINTAVGIVGWMCMTAAVGVFLYITFKRGLIASMTSSTQVIVAPIAVVAWGWATYSLCDNWKPGESYDPIKGGIFTRDGELHRVSREAVNDHAKWSREMREKQINGGRKLDALLRNKQEKEAAHS